MSEVKTSRKLLVSEILRGNPCYIYNHRLRERFNVEIDVTVELALSQADDWDWYWAASRLLTQVGYEKFTLAVDEGHEAQEEYLEPLRAMSRTAHNQARIECNRVLKAENQKADIWYGDASYRAANKVYSEMTEVINVAYEAARKVVQARINKIAAKAFAELYIGEDGTTDPTGNDKWYGVYEPEDDYYEDEDY